VSAVDFAEWAAPDLVFKNLGANAEGVGGHTITVRPPTVDDMSKVLALAVRGEVNLGIVPKETEIPQPILDVLATVKPEDHPALGDAFDEMKAKGINAATIARAAYYAIFHWARGEEYARNLAVLLWAQADAEQGVKSAAAPAPKG
jgi:hypothetical protein